MQNTIVDWPQVLINVKVENSKKNTWDKNIAIKEIIKKKEKEMDGLGRGAQFTDVLIDTLGGSIGILVVKISEYITIKI